MRLNTKKLVIAFSVLSLLVFIWILTVSLPSRTAPTTHEDGRTVIDDAHLFTQEQTGFIARYHAELLKDHDIDYRILTTNETKGIETLSFQNFKNRKVGSLSQSGRGLLLTLAPQSNTVRLEVSAALEGVYTDAFVSYIEHRQMIPFFRSSRIADGILATTEMIFTRAQEAQAGQSFNPPMESFSTGGGVSNPAQIGTGPDNTFRQKQGNGPDNPHDKEESPKQVVAAYLEAMNRRNGDPDLSIYSQETKNMMHSWTVTPAQMDNVAKTFARCDINAEQIEGTYAVVRYAAGDRQCSPYFLVLENGAWKLDLTMMQKAIRFNHRNEWHFDAGYALEKSPYGFAFTDWSFDRNGFPYVQ